MKLFSTAYFPPIQYIAAIAEGMTLSPEKVIPSVIYIDIHEHYKKQSYRNRAVIATADGRMNLNVPVIHDGNIFATPVKDIRIDWSTDWLTRTERAIDAAYHTSAYYDYYRDDLFSVLERKREYLVEMNTDILRFFLEKTGVAADIRYTESYIETADEDYREVIHPKRKDTILRDLGLEKPYFQVFAQKHGFMDNLSIMDLLFNEGPDSIVLLFKLALT